MSPSNADKAKEVLGSLKQIRSQFVSLLKLQGFELLHFHVQPEQELKPAHVTAVLRMDPDFDSTSAIDADWEAFLASQQEHVIEEKKETLRENLTDLLADLEESSKDEE